MRIEKILESGRRRSWERFVNYNDDLLLKVKNLKNLEFQ
jgi:hypothetical protein